MLVGHSLGGDEITAFAVAHPDRTAGVIYLDAAMDHAATLKQVGASSDALPVPSDITVEERSSPEAFRGYFRRTTGLVYPLGEVLALTVPGRNGLLRNRAAPRVNAAIVAATVPPEFARVQAPVLALYSESTVADAFPWLTKASPEYARASAVFHEQLLPMILLERQKFAPANTRATIDTFRAHHYQFLSHPDDTERRMRTFLASLLAR